MVRRQGTGKFGRRGRAQTPTDGPRKRPTNGTAGVRRPQQFHVFYTENRPPPSSRGSVLVTPIRRRARGRPPSGARAEREPLLRPIPRAPRPRRDAAPG